METEITTVFLPLIMNDWKVVEESMTYTLGIDISKWQDNNSTAQQMDFTKSVAMGAKFVFIKSSQALWTDEDILYNWKSAKQAGLLRGAYHFLDWVVDPKKQAQYAWSIIQNDPGELPPVIDFEYWNPPPLNAFDILWNYVVEMERLSGKKPIIYTGAFFWDTYGTDADVWKNYPLWIASYSTQEYMEYNMSRLTPWDTWSFWQYSSSGDGLAFGAESLDLDMNYFNGSLQDLIDFSGSDIVVPEPPIIPEPPVSEVILPELMVIKAVNVRPTPSTAIKETRTRQIGETVKIEEIKVHAIDNVWVRDQEGWSAFVYYDTLFMK